MDLRSSIQPENWPPVLTGSAASLMALQQHVAQTQWWPEERLREHQFQQIRCLVDFSVQKVPFYAKRLAAAGVPTDVPLSEEMWNRIPILTRRELRAAGDALHMHSIPPSHGSTGFVASSGSTGMPVRVRKSKLTNLMWNSCYIRQKLWFDEGKGGTMVRFPSLLPDLPEGFADAANSPKGLVLPNWGGVDHLLWRTGALGLMGGGEATAAQADFLLRLKPQHLSTTPSNLRLLISHFRRRSLQLPTLRAVWADTEVVDDALRRDCLDVFGCQIIANYSAAETGFIGLQCPLYPIYHVQSETIRVEILDVDGQPCKPGEVGRVVVTPLHNFATPLLRYEIGDEAEVGEPCACGRGLPVLKRIVGRTVDYLVLPSGERRRATLGISELLKYPDIIEFQHIQRSFHCIEIMLVVERVLKAEEIGRMREALSKIIGSEFEIIITFHDRIPRTVSGKLRRFISQIPNYTKTVDEDLY